jgi:hypothetical protein
MRARVRMYPNLRSTKFSDTTGSRRTSPGPIELPGMIGERFSTLAYPFGLDCDSPLTTANES